MQYWNHRTTETFTLLITFELIAKHNVIIVLYILILLASVSTYFSTPPPPPKKKYIKRYHVNSKTSYRVQLLLYILLYYYRVDITLIDEYSFLHLLIKFRVNASYFVPVNMPFMKYCPIIPSFLIPHFFF